MRYLVRFPLGRQARAKCRVEVEVEAPDRVTAERRATRIAKERLRYEPLQAQTVIPAASLSSPLQGAGDGREEWRCRDLSNNVVIPCRDENDARKTFRVMTVAPPPMPYALERRTVHESAWVVVDALPAPADEETTR